MRNILLCIVILLSSLLAPADQKKAEKKLNDAERAYAAGNIQRAEKSARDALKQEPKLLQAHALLGDILMNTRRYSAAAESYTAALKADADQKTLTPEQRRALTNQQGVAYGMGGNLARAQEIFEQALQSDPNDPLLHYNLAATFAEKKQLDSALEQLKQAWKLRSNMPSGQQFPDPRKDSSFAGHLNNPRFQDAVRDMVF
jgi:tetratricopeptide (TPR) repeat protein